MNNKKLEALASKGIIPQFKGFNYETSCLIAQNGEEVKFDRKNILHVMYVKMYLLMDGANTLLDVITRIQKGETISDCSTDIDDMDDLETYWLDAHFTDYSIGVNSARNDQLSMQVDEDGNWY